MRSLEYQLGYFVGEYIYRTKLPTLNVDAIHSRKVIYITEGETKKYIKLHENWFNKVMSGLGSEDEWQELRSYHKELARKYLPPILECFIPVLDMSNIIDMDDFKEGIRDSLWDTDLCWYAIKQNEDIEISDDEEAWFKKILLKLDA
jgi:hypothetical protein